MFIVKKHIGLELPTSINLDDSEARILYATLCLVAQNAKYPDANRLQAAKMADELNKVFM